MRLQNAEAMEIADNILKAKLSNVCFILGSGKTTAANALARIYGGVVYRTDERARYAELAVPEYQPALCRDVPEYFALEAEDARRWESDIVREMTPMIIADLIGISSDSFIWCEGDIDIGAVMRVATHAVYIVSRASTFDFFKRPDQIRMLENIRNSEISAEEKLRRIENAYKIVGDGSDRSIPREIDEFGIKKIYRYDHSTPDSVANEIYEYVTRLKI